MADKRRSILIVDDSYTNIHILNEILGETYDLFFSINGEDALNKIKEEKIDLILLDVVMPGMDGLSVCRSIKSDPMTKDILIIFVTSNDEPSEESYGFQIGASDYITKPVSAPIVNARVQTHLALSDSLRIMKEQNSKLGSLVEEKNNILGMAAHDIRAPVGTIQGMCEVLTDLVDNPEAHDLINRIHRLTIDIVTLLEGILDFSSIDSQSLKIEKKLSSITDIVERQTRILSYRAAKKQIKIVNTTPNNLIANVDPVRIDQVISNLVGNAISYGPLGKEVYVQAQIQGNEVCISVRDQGAGIPLEEQKSLFQSFKKLSPRPTGGEKSTGLGLSICKKIIDGHKGRIEVISGQGQGSEFKVYVPLKE